MCGAHQWCACSNNHLSADAHLEGERSTSPLAHVGRMHAYCSNRACRYCQEVMPRGRHVGSAVPLKFFASKRVANWMHRHLWPGKRQYCTALSKPMPESNSRAQLYNNNGASNVCKCSVGCLQTLCGSRNNSTDETTSSWQRKQQAAGTT